MYEGNVKTLTGRHSAPQGGPLINPQKCAWGRIHKDTHTRPVSCASQMQNNILPFFLCFLLHDDDDDNDDDDNDVDDDDDDDDCVTLLNKKTPTLLKSETCLG